MADVPVGAFLSGGLDSTRDHRGDAARPTTRAARSRPSRSATPKTTRSEDELAYARLAADALGTEHHEVRVTSARPPTRCREIVWHLDEPLADPACVPLYFLSSARAKRSPSCSPARAPTRRSAATHLSPLAQARGAAPAPRRRGAAALCAARWRLLAQLPREQAAPRRAPVGAPLEERTAAWRAPSTTMCRAARTVAAPADGAVRAARAALGSDARHDAAAPHALPRRAVWLPDDLLVKADKMTMAHAIELRVPFLDHELMEHAWALPDRSRSRGVGKALLRKAARGRVPQAILDRPKMGFATPTAAWLRGGLIALAQDALDDRARWRATASTSAWSARSRRAIDGRRRPLGRAVAAPRARAVAPDFVGASAVPEPMRRRSR